MSEVSTIGGWATSESREVQTKSHEVKVCVETAPLDWERPFIITLKNYNGKLIRVRLTKKDAKNVAEKITQTFEDENQKP